MENFRLGLFDVFGFILPGLLFIFAASLFYFNNQSSLESLSCFIEQVKEIPFAIGLLVTSYIVGVSIHQLGYYWYYFAVLLTVGRLIQAIRFWFLSFRRRDYRSVKEKVKKKYELLLFSESGFNDKILVKQFTPVQLTDIEEWIYKRAMSFNLSVSFLILFISSCYVHFKNKEQSFWPIVSYFSICSCIMLLVRAFNYDYWWKSDLQFLVKQFDLRSKSLIENKSQ